MPKIKKTVSIPIFSFYLFSHLVAIFFVGCGIGGFVVLDADLLVTCGTLLVRNILVDLLALLLVDGVADVLARGLVVRLVGGAALLGGGGGAGLPVDVIGDSLTFGSVRGFGLARGVDWGEDRGAFIEDGRKTKSRCQETKVD